MNKEEVYKLLEDHYRLNRDTLVKRHARFVKSVTRAEDIVQEAYLRALTYWKSCPYDDTEREKWFGTILLNCLKDSQREERSHQSQDTGILEDWPVACNAVPRIAYQEAVALIEKEPPQVQAILKMSLLHQYASKEIAQVVPEQAAAVRKIVQRFRDKVKEEFPA